VNYATAPGGECPCLLKSENTVSTKYTGILLFISSVFSTASILFVILSLSLLLFYHPKKNNAKKLSTGAE